MTGPPDYWLAASLTELTELSRVGMRQGGDQSHIEWVSRQDREVFMTAIDRFCSEVARHPGVISCVIGHEGLVIAAAGEARDHEGIAAVSQQCVDSARAATACASLGDFQQTLVIGDTYKVAIFWIGGMSISIEAKTGTDLAAALARQPSPLAHNEVPS